MPDLASKLREIGAGKPAKVSEINQMLRGGEANLGSRLQGYGVWKKINELAKDIEAKGVKVDLRELRDIDDPSLDPNKRYQLLINQLNAQLMERGIPAENLPQADEVMDEA